MKRRPAALSSMRWTHFVVLIILSGLCCASIPQAAAAANNDSNEETTTGRTNREPNRLLGLVTRQRRPHSHLPRQAKMPGVDDEIRKQYWRNALAEIRNMSFGFNNNNNRAAAARADSERSSSSGLLEQWKLGVDQHNARFFAGRGLLANETSITAGVETNLTTAAVDRRRRFEGFMSWDRMLQEWADEVQEYMEQIERESSGSDYSLGNFGRGSINASAIEDEETETPFDMPEIKMTNGADVADESTSMLEKSTSTARKPVSESATTAKQHKKTSVQLPIPAPVQPGEAVLPHTDLSDLSKRVEIVTTASLPWRTGTAVNPLLRAAYLTHGRAAAGGSVTLMLPWLERQADQEKFYGKDQTFDTPDAQEAYIRNWLRDAANMPEAAKDLRIRWYTAWQNPAENSIYSMGDITALIPPDEVDICILEEPEHLNWYRAPGESWTKRFKHVVGILHTSMFRSFV